MASTQNQNKPVEMCAVDIQQEYYDAMGDVDWELYKKKDRKYLLQKIAIALFGHPTKEGNLAEVGSGLKLQGYELRDEEATMKVFNKICEQAKYSYDGENILMSILRVVCVAPTKQYTLLQTKPADYWIDLHTKRGRDVTICVFHVFRIRKCISLKPGEKSCRIYIDHDARVYKNWDCFLTENNFPEGVLIVPENGEYRGVFEKDINDLADDGFSDMPKVKLTVIASPALGVKAKVISIADKASMVASLGAGTIGIGVGVATVLSLPVAAPVAATVFGVGAVTSVYGLVRSSMHLADRKKHEQSIGLRDSEARGSWINILVSSVGLSFSAASRLASWAARTGANVTILIKALTFLEYSTMASGLLGIVNGFGEMINNYNKYEKTPTSLELFQFTSSLLFFGIGVMSNQTAKEIVQDAQAKRINEVRDTLTSNSKRKMFDKVTAETRRVQGTIKGNTDVIKGLNTIENKNDFFAKLAKMNKEVNKNKLRVSLSPDGAPMINNQHKVSVNQLRTLGKDGRQQLFAKYGPATVTTKNVPTKLYTSNATTSNTRTSVKDLACFMHPEEIIKITNFFIKLSTKDKEFLDNVLSEISADFHGYFLLLCAELISSLSAEERCLSFLPDCNIRIVLFVLNFLRSKIDESDLENDSSLKIVLKDFIHHRRIKPESIATLKKRLLLWMTSQKKKNGEDPSKYDDIYTIFRKTCRKYRTIQAGHVLDIECHKILVKESTVEKLEEILESYPQNKCDSFIDFCYKLISKMTVTDVDKLFLLNPDEDVLVKVADFLANWYAVDYIANEENVKDEECIKNNIINWYSKQSTRAHKFCDLCNGIRFGTES